MSAHPHARSSMSIAPIPLCRGATATGDEALRIELQVSMDDVLGMHVAHTCRGELLFQV